MGSTSPDFWPCSFGFVCILISSDDTVANSFPFGVTREYIFGFWPWYRRIFRLLRPTLFSIFSTRALTDVGEASVTPPVVPLELLPPVNTGSSNNNLALSVALSSAVKVQVVFSKFKTILFLSQLFEGRLFINSRVKFFQDGCIILSPVVEHAGVVNTIVLKGTFAFISTFAEGEFTIFCFICDYVIQRFGKFGPPPVGGSLKSTKGAAK